MQGFKCNVTGVSTSAKPLAKAQAPVYCENESKKCVRGAKQMLAWNQATGNNIETGPGLTPNYNQKCGWVEGAQKDIFETGLAELGTPVLSSMTPTLAAMSSLPITPTPVEEVILTTSMPPANVAASIESRTSCTARQARYTAWSQQH
jgi:hypothetical protein